MTSPALRLVIEPHHLKHSSNISLLIARHTFEDFLTLLHRAFSTGGGEHQQGSNEPLLIAGYTEESFHQWKLDSKRARLSEPESQGEEGEARVLESEEEGEARAELKSPDVGRPRGPLVSKKLTIPDLCLFDEKGRVLFVIEVCIILPVSFSYFQSPMHIYTEQNAPECSRTSRDPTTLFHIRELEEGCNGNGGGHMPCRFGK